MTGILPSRAQAYELLIAHTKSESLLKHALGVEAAMRAYARTLDGDAELWGITGLLHDFDYEQHPSTDEHPMFGIRILQDLGYPEELLYAIKGHAEYLNVPRVHPMDKALFACDELVGFITAVALVRPSRNLHDVEVASVKKKMKDKAFARAVRREDMTQGAQELGIPLDEHIANVIAALARIAHELRLDGSLQA